MGEEMKDFVISGSIFLCFLIREMVGLVTKFEGID